MNCDQPCAVVHQDLFLSALVPGIHSECSHPHHSLPLLSSIKVGHVRDDMFYLFILLEVGWYHFACSPAGFTHSASKEGISFFMNDSLWCVPYTLLIYPQSVPPLTPYCDGCCSHRQRQHLLECWFHVLWMNTWKQVTRSHGSPTFRLPGTFHAVLHDNYTFAISPAV